jgi:hydrogenase maturation protein HypF
VLAVGAQQKNALAVGAGLDAFPSQHIGDLESPAAARVFRRVLDGLAELHGARPEVVAADPHPDYSPTLWARGLGLPFELVQHHHAHVAACAAENGISGPVLGVAWDGSGAGDDGTIWGGEFLRVDGARCERFGSLRPFRLPGGERAVREPRRSALGLLFEVYGTRLLQQDDLPVPGAFTAGERTVLLQMLAQGVRSPATTSAGRLFDAVACLAGLGTRAGFEGEPAMALEFAAEGEPASEPWPFALRHEAGRLLVDWEPLLAALLDERAAGAGTARLAARFHRTLAAAIVAVARRAGERRVVLSGGCFQNARLTDLAASELEQAGFEVYWHRQVPPNDGGLALGQLVVAAGRRSARRSPAATVAVRRS